MACARRLPGVLLGFLVAIVSASTVAAQAGPGADDDVPMAAVEIDGVVLFHVRGVSSYPADVRAALIKERVTAVARDRNVPVDSVHVNAADGTFRILAGDRPIMTVVDADASLERVTRNELAIAHVTRVREAIAAYRAARSPAAVSRALMNTAGATAALAIVLWILTRFWRWFDNLLRQRVQARIHSVGIQSFEVVRADRIRSAVRNLFLATRTIVVSGIVLVYLGFALRQWPATRAAALSIRAFVLGPLQVLGAGLVANIPRLVFLAVLFLVLRLALKVIRLFFEEVGRGTVKLSDFDPEWAQPTYKIVRAAVVALGLIVAYPYIPGSESAAFKGVSLFIGIIFSLGSSSAIANIIAGYMMTYRRAFKLGDRVKIGDTIGDVAEMRLQVTHLRSLKNEEIIIPNSQILSGEVLNYSSLAQTHGLLLHTEVGIGYETPWRQVEAMLLQAAERTGAGGEPRPFVLLKKLADFAVTYELNVTCREPKQMPQLYTALHRNILDVFNEYGVQIMTPAYESDPADAKIVRPNDWYAAPAQPPSPVTYGGAA